MITNVSYFSDYNSFNIFDIPFVKEVKDEIAFLISKDNIKFKNSNTLKGGHSKLIF